MTQTMRIIKIFELKAFVPLLLEDKQTSKSHKVPMYSSPFSMDAIGWSAVSWLSSILLKNKTFTSVEGMYWLKKISKKYWK